MASNERWSLVLVSDLLGEIHKVSRRLVPFNSFAEYAPEPNSEIKKDVVWFALNDDRPLFAFAGLWTTFNGDRGTKPVPDEVLKIVMRSAEKEDRTPA